MGSELNTHNGVQTSYGAALFTNDWQTLRNLIHRVFCIQGFAVLHKLNLGIYLELSVTVFISMSYMVFVLQFPHKNQCVLKWCPCMFDTGDLHVSTLCSFSYAAIWPLQWCLDKWRLVLINAAFFNFSFEVKKFNIN